MKKDSSVFSLVFFNLIPLFGALFFSWDIFSIIFIYWAENIVIGFYNVLKMWKADKPVLAEDRVKINGKPFSGTPGRGIILFFLVHFGMFTVGHGIFVFNLFYKGVVNVGGIFVGVMGLFISHGISYYQNFIGNQEYKKISRVKQMFQPYSRIVALQTVIIFSGFFVQALGWDIMAVVILVFIKIVFDVFKHNQEHKKYLV